MVASAVLAAPAFGAETIDAALQNAVERGDIPGVVAAVTDQDGAIYEGAFGGRVLGQDVPMTMDTVFYIASMTKPITAAAAMQLVEQGALDLDTPISQWVPEAADLQVLDGWDGDEPQLRAPSREVTLRDLMTHTSGFAYALWNAELKRFMEAENVPGLDSGDEAAFYPPLMFDPGERWEYGISIDWVGKLVETVSGQPLDDYMEEHIFTPLGMDRTGYRLSPDMAARRATLHRRDDDGTLVVMDWIRTQDPLVVTGGGGLYSTVEDYLKFVRMILNDGVAENGEQVLEPETVGLMAENAMGDIRVTMLETTDPARSVDAEFFPGLPKSWGLSFMINEEEAPTGRPAGGLGWAGIQNTFFWIDQENGIGGVYMTQILPFVDEQALSPFYDFETAVYQSLVSR